MENNEIMYDYEVNEETEVNENALVEIEAEDKTIDLKSAAIGGGIVIVGSFIYKKVIKPIATKIKNHRAKKKANIIGDAEFTEVEETEQIETEE